jgi:hypothetical protein
MKTIILKLLLYVALTFGFATIAAYILKQPYRDAEKKHLLRSKLRWDQFYALSPNSTEVVFLGSSHAYKSFNPAIIDSATRLNSFVAGSPAQTPVTSYYVLKNVLRTQSPKTIVFENYFFTVFYETGQLDNAGEVYDNMPDSPVKDEFFRNGFNIYDKCALSFAPVLRYKNNYMYVLKKIIGKAKISSSAKNMYKGYEDTHLRIKQKELTEKNKFDGYVFDSSKINETNIKYFKKIIDLCKQKNIRIIIFTCPVPPVSYKKIRNPNDIDAYFKKLVKYYGVEYYNYLNPGLLGLNQDTIYFSDYTHLNNLGAEIVSNRISNIINRGKTSETNK